jgi:thiol-disulfide isomerase/thioredoxin
MKLLKKHKGNLIFLGILAIVIFTPLGFQLKVWMNRYLYFSPSEITKEDQISLIDYNWNLINNKGIEIDFNDHKEKVVLVNFWATWCPPCVAELPSLQELYNDYNQQVSFLFVANDEVNKVTSFMTKNNYHFPNYFELSTTPPALHSSSIPATFIIDRQGKIRVFKTGATNWNSKKIREILDKLISEKKLDQNL